MNDLFKFTADGWAPLDYRDSISKTTKPPFNFFHLVSSEFSELATTLYLQQVTETNTAARPVVRVATATAIAVLVVIDHSMPAETAEIRILVEEPYNGDWTQ